MAINKKLLHFKTFANFNSQKLSANEENTSYTIGVDGAVTSGAPVVRYESICWIKDTKQMWTHGQLYDCSGGSSDVDLSEYLTAEEIAEIYAPIEKIGDSTYVNAYGISDGAYCYATPSSANGDEDDVFVTRITLKTINGQSLFGGGNIEIESGETNVQSDWLETNTSSDSYVKNRTHHVEGRKITSAGTYGIGIYTPIYYKGKVYNLEVGVRTQIESSAAGVYVTMDGGGNLHVEDAAKYLESFPIMAISKIVPIDDMFIPETIARTSEIKTINGQSLIGTGDITISGGSSSGNSAYIEISHGTADTAFTLTPNTFHIWDEVSSLTLTLGAETRGIANEYLFQFTSGSTATTLSLPDDIKWAGGETPTIEANKIYQISILKGLGSVLSWDAKVLIDNLCTYDGNKTVTFQYPVASDVYVYIGGSSISMANAVLFSVGETTVTISGLVEPTSKILAIDPVQDNTYNYIF